MQYIGHKTNTVYSGDKSNWRDATVEIAKPGKYYTPIIEQNSDGTYTHAGWEQTQADIDRHITDIQSQLESIDAEYHSDRSWREYVITNPDQFSTQAVDRTQQAETEAQALRDELEGLS